MRFTVKRNTGMVGLAMKLDVYVNGEKKDRLANNESKEFEFTGESVEVGVGQGFIRSKTITVKEGETVIAKSSLLGNLFSFFGRSSFYVEIGN
jgi:hypothetical protein